MRFEKRKFGHATAKVSRAAGILINEKAHEAEPVYVRINGTAAHRFYLPSDGVEFQNPLNEESYAEIHLRDARQVLNRGTVDISFGHVSIAFAVAKILSYRDDPNGVIFDHEFLRSDHREEFFDQIDNQQEWIDDTNALDAARTAGGAVWGQMPIAEQDQVKADIGGMSPLEAMVEVTRDVSIDWWVGIDGTLRLGHDSGWGEVVASSATNNRTVFEDYNITQAGNRIKRVVVRGPYQYIAEQDDSIPWGRPPADTFSLQGWADAEASNVDGTTEFIELSKAQSLDELERTAARRLLAGVRSGTRGNAVINGLESTGKEPLARITPGDHIIIDENIGDHCDQNILTGEFVISSVNHNISARRGWRIMVEVSQVPTSIDIDSFLYNPNENKRYETFDAFNKENKHLNG